MDERRERIVELREEGHTMVAIGKLYGISRQRVLQILKEEGYVPDEAEKRQKRIDAAVAELIEADGTKTLAEVAHKHGTISSTLSDYAKAHGFDQAEAVERQRQAEHERRRKGEGTTICRECHQTKEWKDMAKQRANDGTPTRRRVCKACVARRTRLWVRRNGRREMGDLPIIESKICGRCDRDLPASEFWRNRYSKDGLQAWCKQCKREYDKERER